jgi:hypothetical protein
MKLQNKNYKTFTDKKTTKQKLQNIKSSKNPKSKKLQKVI